MEAEVSYTNIAPPRISTSDTPTVIPHGVDGDFCRFDFSEPTRQTFRRLFSAQNCKSYDLFKAEHWLSNSPFQGESVLICRNVRIGGKSSIIYNDEVFLPDQEMPSYLKYVIKHSTHKKSIEEIISCQITRVLETAFVISHPHSDFYGHFLTEIAPKVCIVKRYYDAGCIIPIIIGELEKSYIKKFILIAIPDAHIITVEAGSCLLIQNCLLPSQCAWYLFNASYKKFFDGVVQRCMKLAGDVEYPKRAIISRERVGESFRKLENWSQLAQVAAEFGYEQVSPEALSLTEQICLFGNASHIVGEYGSALHNSLFSAENVPVIAFNWINLVQQGIGLSRRQTNIFLMPDDGIPIKSPIIGDPAGSTKHFSVNPDLLTEALRFIHEPNL
jgi:O-antigen biosynthesis protein WbqL